MLGVSLGFPTYLMLSLFGVDQRLVDVSHNLAEAVDTKLILAHSRIAGMLNRHTAVVFDGDAECLRLPNVSSAVAVVMPKGTAICALIFGHAGSSLDVMSLSSQLGLATMAASHLLEGLQRFGALACPLSPREIECLCFAAAGVPAKDTARWLEISRRTVEEYLVRCRKRLGAKSAQAAAVIAVRSGWLTHEAIEAVQEKVNRQCVAGPGQ